MRLWDLCVHIDANTGFQFDGDVVIPDTDVCCFLLRQFQTGDSSPLAAHAKVHSDCCRYTSTFCNPQI